MILIPIAIMVIAFRFSGAAASRRQHARDAEETHRSTMLDTVFSAMGFLATALVIWMAW